MLYLMRFSNVLQRGLVIPNLTAKNLDVGGRLHGRVTLFQELCMHELYIFYSILTNMVDRYTQFIYNYF